MQVELQAEDSTGLPTRIPRRPTPTVRDERQWDRQPDHRPLKPELVRIEVVTLHGVRRYLRGELVIAILTSNDVATKILKWIPKYVPIEHALPLRPFWSVPFWKLLLILVPEPPTNVEFLAQQLPGSAFAF